MRKIISLEGKFDLKFPDGTSGLNLEKFKQLKIRTRYDVVSVTA